MKAQLGEKGLCCETANVPDRIGASFSLRRMDVVLFTVAGVGCPGGSAAPGRPPHLSRDRCLRVEVISRLEDGRGQWDKRLSVKYSVT